MFSTTFIWNHLQNHYQLNSTDWRLCICRISFSSGSGFPNFRHCSLPTGSISQLLLKTVLNQDPCCWWGSQSIVAFSRSWALGTLRESYMESQRTALTTTSPQCDGFCRHIFTQCQEMLSGLDAYHKGFILTAFCCRGIHHQAFTGEAREAQTGEVTLPRVI